MSTTVAQNLLEALELTQELEAKAKKGPDPYNYYEDQAAMIRQALTLALDQLGVPIPE